jgi:hypothetical protein
MRLNQRTSIEVMFDDPLLVCIRPERVGSSMAGYRDYTVRGWYVGG